MDSTVVEPFKLCTICARFRRNAYGFDLKHWRSPEFDALLWDSSDDDDPALEASNRTPVIPEVRRIQHYSCGSELTQGAKSHCHLCSLTLRRLLDREGPWFNVEAITQPMIALLRTSSPVVHGELRSRYLMLWYEDDEGGPIGETRRPLHHIKRLPQGSSLRPHISSDCCCCPSTNSEATFQMLRSSIEACRKHHRACSQDIFVNAGTTVMQSGREIARRAGLKSPRSERHRMYPVSSSDTGNFDPARLLDVGCGVSNTGEIPGSEYTLRLVEGTSRAGAPYICLSYQWGGAQFFTLTKANSEKLFRGFPLGQLPQLFRDAVTIVLKLGFRYLWIDALCILQQPPNPETGKISADPEDFRREAALMAQVYGRCHSTLAAMDAATPHQSMFVTRNPLVYHDCVLPSDGESGELLIEAGCKQTKTEDRYFEFRHPLDQRGWVFQEAALAPRTIMFGRDMVRFACRELTRCAMYHVNDKDEENVMFQKQLLTRMVLKASDRWHLEWVEDWNRTLRSYTKTNLTNSSDRLIAMAGIGTTLERKYLLQASFGIIHQYMPHSLCWLVTSTLWDAHTARFLPAMAPSWSWATLRDATIGDAMAIFDYDNADEPIPAAQIVRTPKVRPFHTIEEFNPSDSDNDLSIRSRRIKGGYVSLGKTGCPEVVFGDNFDLDVDHGATLAHLDCADVSERAEIHCFIIQILRHGNDGSRIAVGLMLQKILPGKDYYRRVGLWTQGLWTGGTNKDLRRVPNHKLPLGPGGKVKKAIII